MIERSLWIWGIIFIIGFPILNVALAEGIGRLDQHANSLAKFLENVRRFLLPSLTVFLVMREFFGFTKADASLRIVETVFWIAAIVTCVSLVNAVLTPRSRKKPWQIYIPGLFFEVTRIGIILLIAAYILGGVWAVDLSKVAEALGIGSLVMALALQDTLSNLVSGFLLLFEGPFKIGDWIRVGEQEGEVIELNWRAVRLKTRDRDVIIIPNSVLGKDAIYNYTLLDPLHTETVDLKFSDKYPPNLVKRILQSAALATEGILSDPVPVVVTKSYDSFAIVYEVRFYILNFIDLIQVRDDFMTRVYYAAKRNNLTTPVPISIQGNNFDLNALKADDKQLDVAAYLRSLPYFSAIESEQLDKLAAKAILQDYGVGEKLLKIGEQNQGLYIIRSGSVKLSVKDIHDREIDCAYLSKDDIFGEMALLVGELSPVTATVIDDLQVIILDSYSANQLIESNPKFAIEMNYFIEERRKTVHLAQGIENSAEKNQGRNRWSYHKME
ncbi:mechanosensitive ion channel domain-containing protein [Microcoleus sp.]|uniref:mechanosensitive ion channel domain-containing protein n=1 Tax=Microcoleus sp. TaxID=44472 RepID=UPI003523B8EE